MLAIAPELLRLHRRLAFEEFLPPALMKLQREEHPLVHLAVLDWQMPALHSEFQRREELRPLRERASSILAYALTYDANNAYADAIIERWTPSQDARCELTLEQQSKRAVVIFWVAAREAGQNRGARATNLGLQIEA
eukprot:scaffold54361_cov59-Cyclotella_meneghiniana.AAC.2